MLFILVKVDLSEIFLEVFNNYFLSKFFPLCINPSHVPTTTLRMKQNNNTERNNAIFMDLDMMILLSLLLLQEQQQQ